MPDRVIYLEDDIHFANTVGVDDALALHNALQSASPGDVIKAKRGATYWLSGVAALPNRSMTMPPGVRLDPNGATFAFDFSEQWTHGFRMLNDAKIWGEGTIKTAASANSSIQAIDHAPICIGSRLNFTAGVEPTQPVPVDPYAVTHGWKIGGGLNVETAKPDGTGICTFGGMDGHCLIEDVYFPDSPSIGICIGLDWLGRGTYVGPDEFMHVNRDRFDNGALFTVHPAHLVINRVHAGVLSNTNYRREDGGPTVLRMSGVHDIEVSRLSAEEAAGLFRNVGGDFGFEFAPAKIKLRAHKGIRIDRMMLKSHRGNHAGVQIDTIPDNIERARINHGYVPLLSTDGTTDLIVKDVTVIRDISLPIAQQATPQRAFWVRDTNGAKLVDSKSVGALVGVHVDDGANMVRVEGGLHQMAQCQSIIVDGGRRPQNTTVEGVHCIRSGQGGANVPAIGAVRADGPMFIRNTVGVVGDPLEKAAWGVQVALETEGYVISENKVLQVRQPPNYPAISCANGEAINKGRVVNNYVAPGLTPYGGASTVLPSTKKTMQKVGSSWVTD